MLHTHHTWLIKVCGFASFLDANKGAADVSESIWWTLADSCRIQLQLVLSEGHIPILINMPSQFTQRHGQHTHTHAHTDVNRGLIQRQSHERQHAIWAQHSGANRFVELFIINPAVLSLQSH